jgi:type IV pilus assembly protein PilM
MAIFWKKSSLGLEISSSSVSAVATHGRAEAPVIDRYETVKSASELVRPSFKDPNVVDLARFRDVLAELRSRLSRYGKRVSVSLPDNAGKVLILDLETRFRNRSEGAEQVRWKIKKQFPLDVNELHLDYQVLAVRDTGEVSVLVSLISRTILEQYEACLVEAGFEPAEIDFVTFNIFRLFTSRIEMHDHVAVLCHYRGTIGVAVFRDGTLEFYRGKQVSPYGTDAMKLYREINSSLLVYADAHNGTRPQSVFALTDETDRSVFRQILLDAAGVEPMFLDPNLLVSRAAIKIASTDATELLGALAAATRNLR